MSLEIFIIVVGILLNATIVYRCRDIVEWSRWQAWAVVAILCVVPYIIFGFVALGYIGWKIGKAIVINRMGKL